MTRGIRLAKPGRTVESGSSELYVDTSTPLLKVLKPVSGALILNGSNITPQSKGDYNWTYQGQQLSDEATFQVVIPHGLLYVPEFLVYMDIRNLSDRRYATNWIAGGPLDGDIYVIAECTELALIITAYASQNNTGTAPRAGQYGYFAYLFHEPITPPSVLGRNNV